MSKSLCLNFAGYSGFDQIYILFPKRWQTRIVARKWMRALNYPDPTVTNVMIQMPWGSFKVLDKKGNVEKCERLVV